MERNGALLQKGDWALVTGASSGMGKAFAERLAERGLNLWLIGLEKDRLDALSESLQGMHGVECMAIALDLSSPDAVANLSYESKRQGITFGVLINAAGFGYFGDFTGMTQDGIFKLMQVNNTAVIQLCHAVYPDMLARKRGLIINIASIAGFLPYPFAAVYCGGKNLIHLFTRALWAENREKGVKIFSLCPGYSKTNFEKAAKEPDGIHLFRGEDPYDIADLTMRRLNQRGCTIFTRPSHPFKILAAKCLPLKLFAAILDHLRKK